MIPLNIVETFTRTFSLLVRLFGNVMSGVFIVGIILSLAGLFVPIPLMALDLLTGAVQAYIFTVLAMVFIARAVSDGARRPARKENSHELDRDRQHCSARHLPCRSVRSARRLPKAARWRRQWTPSPGSRKSAGTLSRTLFVGLAMIETTAIYCLVIALLLLFANPFIR